MTALYLKLRYRQRGQTMAEYAIMLALISAAVVLAISQLGGAISDMLDKITADIG